MKIFINPKYNSLFVTSLLLSAILSGCRSAQTSDSLIEIQSDTLNNPKIVFAETEHDFGKIVAGAKKSCTFDFINDGGQDLYSEQ